MGDLKPIFVKENPKNILTIQQQLPDAVAAVVASVAAVVAGVATAAGCVAARSNV